MIFVNENNINAEPKLQFSGDWPVIGLFNLDFIPRGLHAYTHARFLLTVASPFGFMRASYGCKLKPPLKLRLENNMLLGYVEGEIERAT